MRAYRKNANDDPGTIESIEKAAAKAARASQKKKKAANRPPSIRDIPKLTKDMLMQSSKATTLKEAQENAILAAKKLYELCDVGRKSNREVMVASGEYDVIGPLTQCLLHEPIYHNPEDVPSAPSPSTMVTLPHQQPRLDGDDDAENGHPNTSTTPVIKMANGGEPTTIENGFSSETARSNNIQIHNNKKKTSARKLTDEKLHFVCLTLNNLSVPNENKRVMVRERGAKRLIGNLCKIVASGKKECHLCLIILMNLTFYEPALTIIGQFSPTPKSSYSVESETGTAKKALQATTTVLKKAANVVIKPPKLTPLENPQSLLRILQELLSNVERGTSDFRWAFGLLANLSRHPENALLISLTGIPQIAIENLRLSKTPSNEWATNSLEDFSLYFILHLAEASTQGLQGALDVAVPIMNGSDNAEATSSNGCGNDSTQSKATDPGKDDRPRDHRGGIQSLKATMVCAFLGLEWEEFPDHGVIAAGNVSELMGNTFERVGKKQVYADNDFGLRTAVSAYAALAKAAARADYKTNGSPRMGETANGSETSPASCIHTKVMALPTSVALLFQIINAIALHWGEDIISRGSDHGNANESYDDTYHWDIKAGELAVSAIMSLLPALLEGTGEDTAFTATMQACADLSKIFVFFSKKTNSISIRARAAEVAEKLTESASGSALPLLEASYDLCRNFGRHRVQKNFL